MKHSDRSKRTPYVKPVQRIELSGKNTTLRLILVVALLAIGGTALMIGLIDLLNVEPGWQVIEVSSQQVNCSQDFTLNYDFSDAGASATAQHKQLQKLYTEATENAFRIFSPDVQEDGLYNVHYLNTHPNEIITVDETLYDALALIRQYENRNLFLAPVYVEYNRIFLCENESDAARFDPGQNPELVDYISQVAAFANDPQMIDVEIMENNQVRLFISEAYLEFLREHEIGIVVDFGWMKNAFITDYLTGVLEDNGFTSGYLASYDGFTRNLDQRGNTYAFNIFDRLGDLVNLPAVMEYDEPTSIVFLRNYPMVDLDRWHYYSFSSGRIVTAFIDPADGMSKSAIDTLVSYSGDAGCGEILLQIIPVFLADTFSADKLTDLAQFGVHSLWCEDQTISYTDADLALTLQSDRSDVRYTAVHAD